MRVLTSTEKEIEALEEEENAEFAEKQQMEARYDFFQKQTDFFRGLSGCLTHRKGESEAVEGGGWGAG